MTPIPPAIPAIYRTATHVRFAVVLALFLASAFSYGDRVVLSIDGIRMARDLQLISIELGHLFSMFSWVLLSNRLLVGIYVGQFCINILSIFFCNYTGSPTLILVLMSLAFLGKGFGVLGWTFVSDISPAGFVGLNGGSFNLCGNLAGITTPIAIGYLVQFTGSFTLALDFVAVAAVGAIACYLVVAGDIRRLDALHFHCREA